MSQSHLQPIIMTLNSCLSRAEQAGIRVPELLRHYVQLEVLQSGRHQSQVQVLVSYIEGKTASSLEGSVQVPGVEKIVAFPFLFLSF